MTLQTIGKTQASRKTREMPTIAAMRNFLPIIGPS